MTEELDATVSRADLQRSLGEPSLPSFRQARPEEPLRALSSEIVVPPMPVTAAEPVVAAAPPPVEPVAVPVWAGPVPAATVPEPGQRHSRTPLLAAAALLTVLVGVGGATAVLRPGDDTSPDAETVTQSPELEPLVALTPVPVPSAPPVTLVERTLTARGGILEVALLLGGGACPPASYRLQVRDRSWSDVQTLTLNPGRERVVEVDGPGRYRVVSDPVEADGLRCAAVRSSVARVAAPVVVHQPKPAPAPAPAPSTPKKAPPKPGLKNPVKPK